MSQATQADFIKVWPDRVPDANLWRAAGPELERPRWENSRLVRNVSQPTLMVFLPEPSIAVASTATLLAWKKFRHRFRSSRIARS